MRTQVAVASIFALLACTTAQKAVSAEWPERPVRIVTPFPAGTGGDIAARFYAERLSQRWEKPVFVENKPGADGILAVMATLGAHDNHTILFTNGGPMTTNRFNHEKLPYDPDHDLVPISSGVEVTVALSVPASLNIRSLPDFIHYARSHPGELNWSATAGVLDYLVPVFLERSGLKLQHVAYKQIAPALQDLAQGRIHLYVSALATQLGSIQSKAVIPLAVTNSSRSTLLADVPTVHELGFDDLDLEGSVSFFAPQDMTPVLLERIGADVRSAGTALSANDRLNASGLVARTTTAAELKTSLDREREKIKAAIALGVVPSSK